MLIFTFRKKKHQSIFLTVKLKIMILRTHMYVYFQDYNSVNKLTFEDLSLDNEHVTILTSSIPV